MERTACLFPARRVTARGWYTVLAVASLYIDRPSCGFGDTPARSETEKPLVTDRPDFTESTETVPTGRTQIEGGYTFTFDREGSDRSRDHTAPELLLRVGLTEDFELRIGWDGYSWTERQFEEDTERGRKVTRKTRSQGANDLYLGFKWKLLKQDGWLPHFGVIGAISLPTGSPSVSSGDVDPEVVLLWAYDVTDAFSVAGNVGFAFPSNDRGRFFQTSASISAGFTLSDRVGAYAEYYGFYPNAENGHDAHFVNGGLTYLITDDFQIDARIGAGLNETADDFTAGVGFAMRF